MALSVKHPEAEKLARQVAELAGTSMTAGVITALQAHKKTLLKARDAELRLRQAREFLEREVWSLPDVHTELTEDEILGYGPSGASE
ncbi:MAG: hypothetical protein A2289_21165 [Deltaproteobacteria bacterium RIFOXYA12_FULL_58_15]|nr:MAG: hypothetical protein A2289_21165 [Deltaproteobacteria bacterium RIFOXYA12_FULL_58_15]OGR08715.1 MAG: hypothetical protein A2341_00775 [Deltaproteobacteria bacterium RIFOXYB12_FULL_58_9]